jgi:hypothetical protein
MATFPSKVNYATGDILTATNMNDVGGAINLLDGAQYAAGKNKIINGDFGVWQRGTSITLATGVNAYTADRWNATSLHASGTATVSRQAFTPGTAPVAGYEGQYFLRMTAGASGSPSAYLDLGTRLENVTTFAGQTVTLSFWAKASASVAINPFYQQVFGSGGSGTVTTDPLTTFALTTSWTRYTLTTAIPSISGKTIGTNSYLAVNLFGKYVTNSQTIDFWGVQLEAASTASNFQTATGTLQGELAACQRYYFRFAGGQTFSRYGTGYSSNTNTAFFNLPLPVSLRVSPTAVDYSTLILDNGFGTSAAVTAVTLTANCQSPTVGSIGVNVASGLTADRNYQIENNGSTAGYIGFTAEL